MPELRPPVPPLPSLSPCKKCVYFTVNLFCCYPKQLFALLTLTNQPEVGEKISHICVHHHGVAKEESQAQDETCGIQASS